MKYIITESQLQYILENDEGSSIKSKLSYLNNFTKKIISDVNKKFNIDLTLLATWGTAVGGLVAPLDNFIRSGNFNVTDEQSSLILTGIVATLFFDNQKLFNKIFQKIKKEGLSDIFLESLKKGEQLKTSFIEFLSTLNLSVNNVAGLIRYSFLIPIISDLQNYANSNADIESTTSMIVNRILASGLVLVSSEVLHEIVKRILSKLR